MKSYKHIIIILILVLSLQQVILSCATPPLPQKKFFGPENIAMLIPENAKLVIFFNFQKLFKLEGFRKGFFDNFSSNKRTRDYLDSIGIDLFKDISFVSGFTTSETFSQEKNDWAFIIGLDYDSELILRSIEDKEEQEFYNKRRIYSHKNSKDKSFGLLFIDEKTIAIGARTLLKHIIDIMQDQDLVSQDQGELATNIDYINRQSCIWGVLTLSQDFKNMMLENMPQFDFLKDIDSTSFSLDFSGNSLCVELILYCRDQELIKQIADIINGIKALIALNKEVDPQLRQFFEHLTVEFDIQGVKIVLELGDEFFKKIPKEFQFWELPEDNTFTI